MLEEEISSAKDLLWRKVRKCLDALARIGDPFYPR